MKRTMLWGGVGLSLALRLLLGAVGASTVLRHRVEVVSPVTSLMRLAEGHWLKQLGMSPYAGSVFHGSPLLLTLLGPILGHSGFILVGADLTGALLLRSMGQLLESARICHMAQLGLNKKLGVHPDGKVPTEGGLGIGDMAALLYLLNPFSIAVCVGGSTSPIENTLTILALYGAMAGIAPLAGFGWAMTTHLGMYPAILIIPIAFLVASGPDGPPSKLFKLPQLVKASPEVDPKCLSPFAVGQQKPSIQVSENANMNMHAFPRRKWIAIVELIVWSAISWLCILGLCSLALQEHGSIHDMWSETYRFILTVEDLSPNLGLFWYFFTEVFDTFRPFFLLVFHANILFMVAPLTIRLHHRPIFLAFILTAISSMLKSYPSLSLVGDAALYLGLMSLCMHELSGLQYSYLLLKGYLLIAILGPVMYNLWIWRGTGNANFYFAMNLVYAVLQTILIVESASTIIRYDRNLHKQLQHQHTTKHDLDMQADCS